VFLSHDDTNYSERAARCPPSVTPAMLVDPMINSTGMTKGFHIKTDAPVSAYSIYPYGGAPSFVPTATLLLPSSSWTKSYVAVSPENFNPTYAYRRRSIQIIANEDDTEVSIRPNVEIAAGGPVAGATAGVTQTWKLSKGQVLQFLQAPMTGSPIETTKPVALFGGVRALGERIRGRAVPPAYRELLVQHPREGSLHDRRRRGRHEAHV